MVYDAKFHKRINWEIGIVYPCVVDNNDNIKKKCGNVDKFEFYPL